MDILVNVKGQKMKLVGNHTHQISGTKNFIRFRFILSDDWKNFAINAVFEQNEISYFSSLNNNCVFLPSEIKEGNCKMSLFGTSGTMIATTNYIPLSISKDISNT